MSESSINIVIGGAAGQGLATIGRLMSKAIVRAGYHLLVCQKYMSRVRGGHNTYAMRIGPEPVVGPTDGIDILVALNAETLALHKEDLNEGAIVLADKTIDADGFNCLSIPFSDLAPKPLFYNIVALGVLGSTVCNDIKILERLVSEAFGKKGEAVVQANLDVLRRSFDWVKEQDFDFTCMAPPPEDAKPGMMLNGNEAIALGAMAAGCNFLSYYPMTPATTVAMTLIAKAVPLGLKYEQVEDEVAAVNMAIGASYAGARSIVTTSGGGFALMVEGISLAGVTETPLVAVVVQRPGPATGMATRTEQSDLNLVLYAGHGEFPRAIFAPSDVEECFYLTHHAFDLAEKYQTPMFVLSDQYLSDSYRNVEPFDLDSLPEVEAPLTVADADYKRYLLTEDGISPRLVPGFCKTLVRSDSHEHDERARITEDGTNRVKQNSKRLVKGCGLWQDVIGPDYYGEEGADIVLMCWGTSAGACIEAAERFEGKSVAVLAFTQVYPLRDEQFMPFLEAAGEVVAVEGNATGQFAHLVAQETGFKVGSYILRFDGRPMTPEYVLNGLKSIF